MRSRLGCPSSLCFLILFVSLSLRAGQWLPGREMNALVMPGLASHTSCLPRAAQSLGRRGTEGPCGPIRHQLTPSPRALVSGCAPPDSYRDAYLGRFHVLGSLLINTSAQKATRNLRGHLSSGASASVASSMLMKRWPQGIGWPRRPLALPAPGGTLFRQPLSLPRLIPLSVRTPLPEASEYPELSWIPAASS